MSSNNIIFSEQLLPCGKTMQNRLVKVAMYEHLSSILGGPPNDFHYALYSAWSEHDWGMIITGNVQVSQEHLSLGRDIVVPKVLTTQTIQPFQKLAKIIHGNPPSHTLAILQLNHSGRQSSNVLGGRLPFVSPLGPSAIRFGRLKRKEGIFSDIFHRLLFQTPKAMSSAEIDDVVSDFVRGASLALQSGFDGIQLHVAHGYLLAQFLSPKSNTRTDEYSYDSLLLLNRIVKAIREVVTEDFILGIKFNASDYSLLEEGGAKAAQEERALAHLRQVVWWQTVDFIEISGGDYENPEFMVSPSSIVSRKNSRQAFFAQFSSKLMKELSPMSSSNERPPLILLTGGLCTPAHLYTALTADYAHLLGIGRASVLCPNLPTVLQSRQTAENDLSSDLTPFKPEPDLSLSFTERRPWRWIWMYVPKVTLIGAGVGMAWYAVMIRRLAEERIRRVDDRKDSKIEVREPFEPDYSIGGLGAVLRMWVWIGAPELRQTHFTSHVAVYTTLMILCLGG
ncbi:hypothetical protein J3R30DRAFT_3278305 [Lentinula aciculospora]|uniref:NADH:flavin oxidoreductase/NADH oxidase N-terminal domain-containing protein n=1 Tax=Lentinula aciculospora TaxID=153920 RepID=A0A9W9ATZ9_9AGAR|nr:hypothetical protein J3R30DRAFT_3278305 [Lentinula aciculospora]